MGSGRSTVAGQNYDRAYGPKEYQADGRKASKRAKPGEINYARLFEAMRSSRRILQKFREERLHMVRQFVGRHYSDGGTELKVPVNLLNKYVSIMARALVPKCPRAMLSTQNAKSQAAVSAMQEWMNNRLIEMNMDKTLQRWAIDAMFSLGILKVALGTPADAAVSGYVAPAGQPFAETVDLDDFAFDAGCKDFRQASWIGHRYRIPLEIAESLDYFDKKAREKLSAMTGGDEYRINQEGDDRIGIVGQGWQSGETRDFEPMIDLWEIYVPRLKRVCTFASHSGGVPDSDTEPLRIQEWVGPDCGPFHFLAFMPVPGSPMPSAPLHHLIDLHEFVNHGYRKATNQMQRQKEVLPVRGGQVDDAKQLVQANDGDAFSCENAESIKAVSYGGPNPVNLQFTMHLADVFNKQAGNLDLLAGSAAQSKTATQDKLLNENAGANVSDMQEAMTDGAAKVLRAMGWFWWYHPQEVMTSSRAAPGLPDISIQRKLYPYDHPDPTALKREGRFEDLAIRIDPYSMVYRTPQQRLQFMLMLFDKFAPAMQMFNSQGVQMDLQFLLKKISEYADEPDVVGMFTIAEPTAPGGEGGGEQGPMKPNSTTRNYTRQSEGQDTEAARGNDMANMASEYAAQQE